MLIIVNTIVCNYMKNKRQRESDVIEICLAPLFSISAADSRMTSLYTNKLELKGGSRVYGIV